MIENKRSVLDEIRTIVGTKYLITKSDLLYNYSKDCTSNKAATPVSSNITQKCSRNF